MKKDESRVFAELALTTLFALDEDSLALVAPSVVRAAAELAPWTAPVGLLVDLTYLLVGPPVRLDLATARASGGIPTDDPRLRAAVVGVFDALLAPIATSSTLTDIKDALARHPSDVARDTAGVLVAEIVQRSLERQALPAASKDHAPASERAPRVADLRRAFERSARELWSKGTAALTSSDRRASIAAAYEAIARSARRSASALDPSDVVVAEGAPHLRHRAARLALRQLADAELAILKLLPAAILHRRSRGTDVSTREHDESTYPMGGFASMTNVGSLENVVTSELGLSSDGDIGEDLFAIRWATGELLYYTRDESVAHRRRVSIWIAVDEDLARSARVKDPEAPWQRLVLALAAVAAYVERAVGILRQEALSIRILLPPAFDEERTLLGIRLADAIERGVVEIREATASDAAPLGLDEAKVADIARIEMGTKPRLPLATLVEVAARPRVQPPGEPPGEPIGADPVACWAEAVRSLLVVLP